MKTAHKGFNGSGWPMEVAMTVLIQGAEYVFEQRPDDPRIGAAGTLAAIGGKIEWGELADQAASRELSEETNLRLRLEDLKRLGMVSVTSDLNGEAIEVDAHTFEAWLPCDVEVESRGGGGKVVKLFHDQLRSERFRFSPATGEIVDRTYLNSEQEEEHGSIDY